ncbi:AGE family epimerase/isomerase [Dongia deserti]|uniref:AGE family epimerase/isomerase n=1 Tax=Dongia deserti TaxID=2268030 RepID=UPI0025475243|nr:AGE family epimerase/isomerase [Dongia deserti]
MLASAVESELRENLLPFWVGMQDMDEGGFVGAATSDGRTVPSAPKGAVLHARILWAFSAAYLRFSDPVLLTAAKRAHRFIVRHLIDPVWGGVFWAVSPDGEPIEKRKHLYAQAFAIYGLSAFHRASGDPAALELAQQIWRAIERHAPDPGAPGYVESFTRDWRSTPNTLFGRGAVPKTFNTHFHLLEAYAALLEVWPDPAVLRRVEMLAMLMAERLLDHPRQTFWQRFEADWQSLDQGLSHGHDIGGSWLILTVADTLASDIADPVRAAVSTLAGAILDRAVEADGGVATGLGADGQRAPGKIWWVQAEALVGFLDAFERQRDVRFLGAAEGVWGFIQQFMIDRTGGEWRSWIAPAGTPQPDMPKVGFWKCPYHTVRACLETLKRSERLSATLSE